MPGLQSRLEEINRFRAALRGRMRCLEAALGERLCLGSESQLLQQLRLVHPGAELVLVGPAAIHKSLKPEPPLASETLVLVTQSQGESLAPQFVESPNTLQAWIDPNKRWDADRCYSLLMQCAHGELSSARTLEHWGSSDFTPAPNAAFAAILASAEDHARGLISAVQARTLRSDGFSLSLSIFGPRRLEASIASFGLGLAATGVNSALLLVTAAPQIEICYTLHFKGETRAEQALSSAFVLTKASGQLGPKTTS